MSFNIKGRTCILFSQVPVESSIQPHKLTSYIPKMLNILIINPNSSSSMTLEMEKNVNKTFEHTEDVKLTYFTGPLDSPSQIENVETSIQSMNACLPVLSDPKSKFYYNNFHGILVACFSDHPLVYALRELNKSTGNSTRVLGLLDSTISYCNMLNDKHFSIITSNKEWVTILNTSVEDNFLTKSVVKKNLWRGTVSTDLQVLDLHERSNYLQIVKKIKEENIKRLDSDIVILGCAGFSGLQDDLTAEFNNKVIFIDPVICGLRMILVLIKG